MEPGGHSARIWFPNPIFRRANGTPSGGSGWRKVQGKTDSMQRCRVHVRNPAQTVFVFSATREGSRRPVRCCGCWQKKRVPAKATGRNTSQNGCPGNRVLKAWRTGSSGQCELLCGQVFIDEHAEATRGFPVQGTNQVTQRIFVLTSDLIKPWWRK